MAFNSENVSKGFDVQTQVLKVCLPPLNTTSKDISVINHINTHVISHKERFRAVSVWFIYKITLN